MAGRSRAREERQGCCRWKDWGGYLPPDWRTVGRWRKRRPSRIGAPIAEAAIGQEPALVLFRFPISVTSVSEPAEDRSLLRPNAGNGPRHATRPPSVPPCGRQDARASCWLSYGRFYPPSLDLPGGAPSHDRCRLAVSKSQIGCRSRRRHVAPAGKSCGRQKSERPRKNRHRETPREVAAAFGTYLLGLGHNFGQIYHVRRATFASLKKSSASACSDASTAPAKHAFHLVNERTVTRDECCSG